MRDIVDPPWLGSASWLDVIDTHTCGQPTRVIVGGAGLSAGRAPAAARLDLAGERDWVRRLAVFEPRGHRSMFAAAVIPPAAPGAEHGVVFMDVGGYPDMCGHATIGVATALIEYGLVALPEPRFSGAFRFGIETPVGRIALTAQIDDGRCGPVAFEMPFAYHLGTIALDLGGADPVGVDISYGGQWYAFVPAAAVGLEIVPDQIDALAAAAADVRARIAARLTFVDPRSGTVPNVHNIVWTSPPRGEGAARNVPISGSGSFDRSPCGTATCARIATLVDRGDLAIGEPFVNEGIMGTLYRGAAAERAIVDGVDGIVVRIEGCAWITARARLVADPRDPLRAGYVIGNGPAIH